MPTKPTQKFTAWSFSRYNDWRRCPLYAKLKHLDRMREPEGPALARGNEIHSQAEKWSLGAKGKIPASLINFKEEFKELRAAKPSCEESWALASNWTRTDWFAKTAWLRLKIDAWYVKKDVLHVIDHKTGKIYPEAEEQMDLYGTVGLALFPQVRTVRARLWYLDQGEEKELGYDRKSESALRKGWEKRVAPMLSDVSFLPKPNDKCKWCAFQKAKGGPCKY